MWLKINNIFYYKLLSVLKPSKANVNTIKTTINFNKSKTDTNIDLKNVNYVNTDIILLTMNIYKTVNLLNIFDRNIKINKHSDNIIMNCNKISNYQYEIQNILYINSKNKFLIPNKLNYSLMKKENKYYLDNSPFFNKLFTNTLNLNNMSTYNFTYQKLFLNNVKKNLDYSKQTK